MSINTFSSFLKLGLFRVGFVAGNGLIEVAERISEKRQYPIGPNCDTKIYSWRTTNPAQKFALCI
ncbi:MAG: hypothetical protein ACQETJ_01210, partial [Bacteroidota bacterium]